MYMRPFTNRISWRWRALYWCCWWRISWRQIKIAMMPGQEFYFIFLWQNIKNGGRGSAIIKKQKVHKAKIEAARELRKKKNNYMSQDMIDKVPWGRQIVDAKNLWLRKQGLIL
ncbi:hypothetical protein Pint_06854 [Pistacia integerrima]|uniref:Uncharacterized protein n=1 Tax=Pistacia integerrima TaxID=434235 RepID=A0ACC0XSI1_9ROSI|nr:hypothetical protein Pint_06854 [Pistacia integerrima]